MKGKDDKAVFALARKLDRMILTSDEDFWDDSKFPIDVCLGVVIISQDVSDREIAMELLNLREVVFPFREIWDRSKIKLEGSGKMGLSQDLTTPVKSRQRYIGLPKHKVYEWVNE